MKKTKIIVVAGPTASGKTSLAAKIAHAVDGEIISADSMQIYKGMRIATAAPTEAEKENIPYHLTEFLERDKSFSVSDFCTLASAAAEDISSRGRVPVIAGGTGLFIDSFVDNIKFVDSKTDFDMRRTLMKRDAGELYSELVSVDPQAAEKIHKNNKIRIVRALEIYYSSGVTKSFQDMNSRTVQSPFETLYFVLDYKNRDILYDRINRRIDSMLENGLVDEARRCLSQDTATAAQAIGHKEFKPYFDGDVSLEEAVESLKRETRRYAKRQITWFKRRKNAIRLYADENADVASLAIKMSRDFLNG